MKRAPRPAIPPTLAPGPEILAADRTEPEKRRRLGAPAIRTFLQIAEEWGLDEEARLRVLGFPARATYFNWVRRARAQEALLLPVDTLLRLSAVLGVYKNLGILFDQAADRLGWLKEPHGAPTFGGQPPLALVTSGTQDGILAVRRYLDAMRGGIFAAPNAADAAAQTIDVAII